MEELQDSNDTTHDTLIDLFDCLGFYGNNDSNSNQNENKNKNVKRSRQQQQQSNQVYGNNNNNNSTIEKDIRASLILSIKSLRTILLKLQRNNNTAQKQQQQDGTTGSNDVNFFLSSQQSQHELLEIESLLTTISTDLQTFVSTYLPLEYSNILSCVQSIHNSVDTQTTQNDSSNNNNKNSNRKINCINLAWREIVLSLLREYEKYRNNVILCTRNLTQFLDRFYSLNLQQQQQQSSSYQILNDTIQCIENKQYLSQLHYRHMAEILINNNMHDTNNERIQNNDLITIKQNQFSVDSGTDSITTHSCCQPNYTVLKELNIVSALNVFLQNSKDHADSNSNIQQTKSVTFLLVVGSQGSGKTFLCDTVAQLAINKSIHVIRPHIPVDLMRKSVGEVEDLLISLFDEIYRCEERRIVLIIDCFQNMIRSNTDDEAQQNNTHWTLRVQTTLLTLIGKLRQYYCTDEFHFLALFTSDVRIQNLSSYFDQVYYLQLPNDNERKSIIQSIFPVLEDRQPFDVNNVATAVVNDHYNALLSDLVISTSGRSYAEIVLACQQSIEHILRQNPFVTSTTLTMQALSIMKERLHTTIPASLRLGLIDDYAEIKVSSCEDLAKRNVIKMNGPSATKGWNAIEMSIIIPLCYSTQLQQLMDPKSVLSYKPMVGGVLLTGEPGSGKSEIALQCAIYASTINKSIKLVEVSCTSLIHKEVGGSEKSIRYLFEAARQATPCIIVLDGIENIAAVRGNDTTTEGTMDRVLSTLLIELDGITTSFTDNKNNNNNSNSKGGSDGNGSSGNNMAIIGITRDASWIDPALKRPGRLGTIIQLELDSVS